MSEADGGGGGDGLWVEGGFLSDESERRGEVIGGGPAADDAEGGNEGGIVEFEVAGAEGEVDLCGVVAADEVERADDEESLCEVEAGE